jgi:hypothetical protein
MSKKFNPKPLHLGAEPAMPRPSSLTRHLAFAAALAAPPAFGQALVQQGPAPTPEQGVTIGPNGPVRPTPPPGRPAPPSADLPQVYKLTISPAAGPIPPLKYQFSVPVNERQPGNSVPFYYRALVQLGNRTSEQKAELNKAFEKYADSSPADLPKDEVRTFLANYSFVFTELDRAALREETRWDWRLEELDPVESISFLLPEIQESRQLARLLAIKAKFEIAEGRFDAAARTLRNGYALGQAVAEPPTLINDLVGVAIAAHMDGVVRDWIAAPGSPNLYWAVTSLPTPFIDLRPALEYELAFPYRFAPWLKDAETDSAPPEVWRDRLARSFAELRKIEPFVNMSGPTGPNTNPFTQALLALLSLRTYPDAKRDLIARGYDAARVEAMPVGQVIAIQQKFVDDVIAQELLKETLLPPAAAAEVGKKAEQFLHSRRYLGPPSYQTGETIPLMSLLAPATRQASKAGWRLQGILAGLRTIEAVRMHAAATGALPNSLDEIKAVPVPNNPVTGKPFAYALHGQTATLDIDADPTQPRVNWHLEITLKK